MKQFLELLLTKLGLGVGAITTTPNNIMDNLHSLFGEDFTTTIEGRNPYLLHINYKNEDITIKYSIIEGVVSNIEVQ